MSAPRDLNDEHTKDLVRINAAKHWGSFYGNAMSMDLDVWLNDFFSRLQKITKKHGGVMRN